MNKNNINLQLVHCDSRKYLEQLLEISNKNRPEVIYLDPMYSASKKTALNKKELRILAKLVGKDADADKLLLLALKVAKKRVVVKRARLAPNLANLKPDTTFTGRTTRFDVYLIQ